MRTYIYIYILGSKSNTKLALVKPYRTSNQHLSLTKKRSLIRVMGQVIHTVCVCVRVCVCVCVCVYAQIKRIWKCYCIYSFITYNIRNYNKNFNNNNNNNEATRNIFLIGMMSWSRMVFSFLNIYNTINWELNNL